MNWALYFRNEFKKSIRDRAQNPNHYLPSWWLHHKYHATVGFYIRPYFNFHKDNFHWFRSFCECCDGSCFKFSSNFYECSMLALITPTTALISLIQKRLSSTLRPGFMCFIELILVGLRKRIWKTISPKWISLRTRAIFCPSTVVKGSPVSCCFRRSARNSL